MAALLTEATDSEIHPQKLPGAEKEGGKEWIPTAHFEPYSLGFRVQGFSGLGFKALVV